MQGKALYIYQFLEAAAQEEKWQSRNNTDLGLEIPILMKNKVPEGYEEDEKLDVTLRPDEVQMTNFHENIQDLFRDSRLWV